MGKHGDELNVVSKNVCMFGQLVAFCFGFVPALFGLLLMTNNMFLEVKDKFKFVCPNTSLIVASPDEVSRPPHLIWLKLGDFAVNVDMLVQLPFSPFGFVPISFGLIIT